ncbi:MAG: mechanosensitive ion channel [Solirubrobacteraceae bacterium]
MEEIKNTTSFMLDFLAQQDNPILNVLKALIMLLLGSFIARILSKLIGGGLRKVNLDEKFKGANLSFFIQNLVYAFIMVFVLIASLELLGLTSVLSPLNEMMTNIMSYVPNVIAAILVLYIGYLLANMVSNLIESIGEKIKQLALKFKLPETLDLVKIVKNIAFVSIMFIVLTGAADTLQIEAISTPLKQILNSIAVYFSKIIGAILLICVFGFAAKFISNMLNDLMKSFNIDMFAQMFGINKMLGGMSITMIISKLTFFFITYFGVLEVVDVLGFDPLTIILNDVLRVIGKILFGLLILLIGNLVANRVYSNLSKNEEDKFIASVSKMAILALFLSMGLTQMDLGASIINLAFGLVLGSIALVVGLSYGLGGREAAGEHMKELINKFRKK